MAAALMAAGAWAGGPQTVTTHQRPATPSTVKRPAGQPKLSDAQLEAVIRAKFAKSKINADKFTVRVQGGVATTRMCRTAGAAVVNNRVQISDSAKAKAAGNLEQGRLRVQVKREDARSMRE